MTTGGMSKKILLRSVKLAKKVAEAEVPTYSHRFAPIAIRWRNCAPAVL